MLGTVDAETVAKPQAGTIMFFSARDEEVEDGLREAGTG